MAPNTRVPEPERHGMVKNSNSTTILPKGTVESRGMGTNSKSRDAVSQEIREFIDGEGNSIWAEIRSFFTVWLFVTRLPSPSWVDAHPGYLMRGMTYFPLCGAIIGTIVSAFYDVLSITLSLPLVASSILSEAVSLWCTGCFHEDGLADSADGIGGGWSREQILKIMMDTRLGTFGCAALLLYMIGKVDVIATLGRSVWKFGACEGGGPAIVVTQSLSRLVAPVLINTREYVDEGGPKYQFYSFFLEAKYLVTWIRAVVATVLSLVVSAFMYGFTRGASLTIVTIIMAFFSGQYANRILGGVMGDYIGGTICITEVVLLIYISSWESVDKHILFLEYLSDTFWDYANEGLNMQMVIEKVLNNDQSFAAFKFAITVSILLVWCKNVGYQLDIDKVDPQDEAPKRSASKQENTGEISDKDVGKSIDLQELLLDPERNFAYRYDIARSYVDSLAKPVGSLGTLEDWAARIAALQRTIKPSAASTACLIFAADHGVAKDKKNGGLNCSAYPQQVTKKVLEGLDHGIAGASVLAEINDVTLRVIDVGVAAGESENSWSGDVVRSAEFRVKGGTENFCTGSALTVEQLDQCLLVGRNETRKFIDETDASVMIFGEVGIGNTTTSSALIAWLSDSSVELLCGSGATTSRDGTNHDIVSNKISIVKKAMQYHSASNKKENAVEALNSVGGAEITAIVGGILEASERDVPILIDGFIVTVAGMIACKIDPQVCRCLLFATKSTEVGQQVALKIIAGIAKDHGIPENASPALDMNLRMGEATGALSAVPLVRSACAVISKLATLEDVLSMEAKDKQIR